MSKVLITMLVILSLFPYESEAVIHANTHYGNPRIEPGKVINDFEESLLISNVMIAIKFADVQGIKANIAGGLNPFKVNKDGFAFMDAFISISNNYNNEFGDDMSDLVNSLMNFSKSKVKKAVDAAVKGDAITFKNLLKEQGFYYYTPIAPSKLIGHKVIEVGCLECLRLLQEFDYNLSIPAPDGTSVF